MSSESPLQVVKAFVGSLLNDPRRDHLLRRKFETRAPNDKNAIELFAGHWATDLSKFNPNWIGGSVDFSNDPRPALAAHHLGTGGRLDGMSVLELGPLEAMHTAALEALGAARILAIESNSEAYLKCLIIKEVLCLKAVRFMLGDFNLYLAEATEKFDLIFCSGVLYHLDHPLGLIRDLSRTTSKVFCWTHYYDPTIVSGRPRRAESVTFEGFSTTYFRDEYPDRNLPEFWGGNRSSACWMKRDDILRAFGHFGFDRIDLIKDQPREQNGPVLYFAAAKTAG